MRRFPLVKSRLSVFVPSVLVFLVALAFVLAAMPTHWRKPRTSASSLAPPGSPRAIASGPLPVPSICSTTPFWRPCSTSTPRRGNTHPVWRKSGGQPDLKEWTFYLRKGVQFHYGFGEFTAKDVVHSFPLIVRQDSTVLGPIVA